MNKPSPQEWFGLTADEASGRAGHAMRLLARDYAAAFARQGIEATPLTDTAAMKFADTLASGPDESTVPSGRWFVSRCGAGRDLAVSEDGRSMALRLPGVAGTLLATSDAAMLWMASQGSSPYRPAGLVLAELVATVQDDLEAWSSTAVPQIELSCMPPAKAREHLIADIGRYDACADFRSGSGFDIVAVRFRHATEVVAYNDQWVTVPAGTISVASRDRNGTGRWIVHVPSRQGVADLRKADVEFLEEVPEWA